MQRIILYGLIGFLIGFLLHLLFNGFSDITIYSFFPPIAFGLAGATAYSVDRPDWKLSQKLGVSLGVAVLFFVFVWKFFNQESALEASIRYCLVFVFYNVIASFRKSKSLRN